MSPAVMLLSDLSYKLGIIGLIEYQERLEIYRWLKDNSNNVADPRNAPGEDYASSEKERMDHGSLQLVTKTFSLQFLTPITNEKPPRGQS